MNTVEVDLVLRGALSMASWVAGLFFLRFWRSSGERLFLFFCLAFWILGVNWLSLALMPGIIESRHYLFVLRLLAFILIIIGTIDKNRRDAH